MDNERLTRIGIEAGIDFYRTMSVDQLECNGVIAFVADLIDPILNIVFDTETPEARLDETISAVFQFYLRHQKDWFWVVNPYSKPTSLSRHLQQHGLSVLEDTPGMYFDLTKALPTLTTQALEIREVSHEDALLDWVKPAREAFPSSDQVEGYRRLNARLAHGMGTAFRHYVGYYQDQPVSSGTLFISKQAVMIHNLATIPHFRKQGFGSAIVVQAMKDAKQLGMAHCFLDSSAQGLNVYRSLGFQIYCPFQLYGKKEVNNV